MFKYIRAMAFPKAMALQKAGFYCDQIIEHVIKIVLYHDVCQDDVPHWVNELANWISSVDNITIKPNNKKLKPADIEDTTFGWMGTELKDYHSVLDMFQENNRRGKFNTTDKTNYTAIQSTPELAEELMDVCYDLMNQCIPLICDKADHARSEYVDALNKVFKNYL